MKKILAKAIYAIFGKSIEAERRQWKRHCVEMQNALNEEHHKRFGWYVSAPDHRLIVEKQGVVLW